MAVLEVVQSNLVSSTPGWVSAVKGTGTSEGDVDAGTGSQSGSSGSGGSAQGLVQKPVTVGDRIGAGILTGLVVLGVVGGTTVMVV